MMIDFAKSKWLLIFVTYLIIESVHGFRTDSICHRTSSCTTRVLGQNLTDESTCKLEYFPADSIECIKMNFGPLESKDNIGGVQLRPHMLPVMNGNTNVTYHYYLAVLNITFRNIRWKTMKFRFQVMKSNSNENHCRNIVIAHNLTMNDQSILYYDCYSHYSANDEGLGHILDFEATGVRTSATGRYYFNLPRNTMISDAKSIKEWLPFIYLEQRPKTTRLHIAPITPNLEVHGYSVKVMEQSRTIFETILYVQNHTDNDIIFDYKLSKDQYFVVTPLHQDCENECQSVRSPNFIESEVIEGGTISICIASLTALVVSSLFAYYVLLRVLRKYFCKDEYSLTLNDIPQPTKVLVVYSPTNRLHAKCVESFVHYLRLEYGLDVAYDGDISSTPLRDPELWANQAFDGASHILYIVGPPKDANLCNSIYDGPITAYRNLDTLILSYIKHSRATNRPKSVINVFFEHSTGPVPEETRFAKSFYLLGDWHKLIAHLSQNLLPKKHIMRTDKGKCFIDDLASAKKLIIDSGLKQNV